MSGPLFNNPADNYIFTGSRFRAGTNVNSLRLSNDLPLLVKNIPVTDGLVLAANYKYNPVHELEGDVEALRLINLDTF